MGELKYRYPKGEIRTLKGGFVEKNQTDIKSGDFVLASAMNERLYVFQSGLSVINESDEKTCYVASKNVYFDYAKSILDRLKVAGSGKAVVSRVKEVVNLSESYFDLLTTSYPNAFVYEFFDANLGHWFGASPEILLDSTPESINTMALAGTLPVGKGKWSSKEYDEQHQVTAYIQGVFGKLGFSYSSSDVYERVAGPVRHLCTDINVVNSNFNILELAMQLSPTPAVVGFPYELSKTWIEENEPHKRDLYTGFLGEYQEQNTRLYVNLRCAQKINDKVYLYLGGGFTKDSVIENEWDETENKAKTLLKILNAKN